METINPLTVSIIVVRKRFRKQKQHKKEPLQKISLFHKSSHWNQPGDYPSPLPAGLGEVTAVSVGAGVGVCSGDGVGVCSGVGVGVGSGVGVAGVGVGATLGVGVEAGAGAEYVTVLE